MTDRKTITRFLERLGFQHVSGWVRKEDAPRIVAKIKAAIPAVEAAKAERNKNGIYQTGADPLPNSEE